METVQEVAEEVEALGNEHGAEYALAKLMESASKITGMEIKPIHEDEMRQARKENLANGIYFPEDDPDKW